MPDEIELVDLVKRAYEEEKSRYIKEEELLAWLRKNGLTQEETKRAIHIAMKQDVIQFCYPSSVGGKGLVPCYERITKEDVLPPELLEEMRMKNLQKELRETRANKKRTR